MPVSSFKTNSGPLISNETTNWYQFVQFVQIYMNYHTNAYQSINIIPICMIKAANLFLVRNFLCELVLYQSVSQLILYQ